MAEAKKHLPDEGCARGKAEGAFIALAAGDALGWPQEFSRKLIRPKNAQVSTEFYEWVRRGGGRFYPHEQVIGAGEYSDDTQLMVAVARCRVIASPGWWTALTRTELPLWTLYERGGGGATKRAAESWVRGLPPWQDQKKNGAKRYFEAGGNGVAMRIVPHAIFFAGQSDASELIHDVVMDGVATHGHPRALVGAAAYAFAAWWYLRSRKTVAFGEVIDVLLNEVSVWGALPAAKDSKNGWFDEADAAFKGDYGKAWRDVVLEMQALLERVQAGLKEGAIADDDVVLKDLGAFGKAKGAGTVSVAAALYLAARYAAQPAQGILRAAFAHGTDTDTVAAMVGGLAGCLAGSDWVPREWFHVQDSEYLRTLANRVARGPKDSVERPQALAPVGARQLDTLRDALVEGHEGNLDIDGVRKAQVADFLRPPPLSETTLAQTWSLRTDDGQTIYITKCSRRAKNDPAPERSDRAPSTAHRETAEQARIGGVKLSVRDVTPAASFYESVFGLRATKQTRKFATFGILSLVEFRYAQELSAGAVQENAGPPRNRLEIRVSNLEACLARVEEAGGRIIHGITTTHWGDRVFHCSDVDGNLVEVIESR